jgi:hypothetical protein
MSNLIGAFFATFCYEHDKKRLKRRIHCKIYNRSTVTLLAALSIIVKVKLSLCLTNEAYAMKAYGEADV